MQSWLLQLGRTHWVLLQRAAEDAQGGDRVDFEERDLVAQADAINEALNAGGYRGEPIVVGLQAGWCLSAMLSVARTQELRDRQTMLYRLEENIPLSVEESIGDYFPAGTSALMVAAPAVPLADFFRRLEELGVQLQAIVPNALLACAEHALRSDWPAQHVLALQEHEWIDLIFIDNHMPQAWLAFPADLTTLELELKRHSVESGTPSALVAYGFEEAAITGLERSGAANLIHAESPANESASSLAAAAAAKIGVGQLDPPVNLKRDAFGRRRGNVALRRYAVAMQAAVACLFVAVTVVLFYRSHLAGRQADALAAQQAEVFRSVFPNARVPVGIRGRLESELAKLKGLQGDDVALPASVSATRMLYRLLTAMPSDRRFRLLEIRIEQGRLYLDGEVIGHSDAEAIAQRLRAEGFEISSPRTQRLDDKRVSLRITGTLIPNVRIAAKKK